MANSSNTTWIVSVSKWTSDRGIVTIDHCEGRSYRNGDHAREKYDAVVESLRDKGYSISRVRVPREEDYEGVQARLSIDIDGQHLVRHALVFIDRNPVWTRG